MKKYILGLSRDLERMLILGFSQRHGIVLTDLEFCDSIEELLELVQLSCLPALVVIALESGEEADRVAGLVKAQESASVCVQYSEIPQAGKFIDKHIFALKDAVSGVLLSLLGHSFAPASLRQDLERHLPSPLARAR